MAVLLRIHLALKVYNTKETDIIKPCTSIPSLSRVPQTLQKPRTGFITPFSQSEKQSSKQGKRLGNKLLRLLPFSSYFFIEWPVLAGSTFLLLLRSSISTTLGGLASVKQKLWRKSVISMNSGRHFGSSAQQDSKRGIRAFGTSCTLGLSF
jgi:hypothetical protein